MKITRTIYVTDRSRWRAWLRANHRKATEVWILYPKKHTGRARIPYDDAVEEALCYGWIDSNVQTIDANTYAQRFTPRRPGSAWSASNRERVLRLTRQGRMTKAGLAFGPPVVKRRPVAKLPPAAARAIRAKPRAWAALQRLAPSYRRAYVGWIAAAKRPETRARRIREAVSRLSRGEKLGMK